MSSSTEFRAEVTGDTTPVTPANRQQALDALANLTVGGDFGLLTVEESREALDALFPSDNT